MSTTTEERAPACVIGDLADYYQADPTRWTTGRMKAAWEDSYCMVGGVRQFMYGAVHTINIDYRSDDRYQSALLCVLAGAHNETVEQAAARVRSAQQAQTDCPGCDEPSFVDMLESLIVGYNDGHTRGRLINSPTYFKKAILAPLRRAKELCK